MIQSCTSGSDTRSWTAMNPKPLRITSTGEDRIPGESPWNPGHQEDSIRGVSPNRGDRKSVLVEVPKRDSNRAGELNEGKRSPSCGGLQVPRRGARCQADDGSGHRPVRRGWRRQDQAEPPDQEALGRIGGGPHDDQYSPPSPRIDDGDGRTPNVRRKPASMMSRSSSRTSTTSSHD